MSDAIRTEFTLLRRPAIGISEPLRFGDLTLTANLYGTILHLLSRPGDHTEAELLAVLKRHADASLRDAGPGQWFAVWDWVLGKAEIDQIAEDLAGIAFLVDQTDGRVRINLTGAPVRQVLSKGTGVDLHTDCFPIGAAAMTLVGHIGVNLTRVGEDAFELLVLRGFAESLWHDLETMSAEFG